MYLMMLLLQLERPLRMDVIFQLTCKLVSMSSTYAQNFAIVLYDCFHSSIQA